MSRSIIRIILFFFLGIVVGFSLREWMMVLYQKHQADIMQHAGETFHTKLYDTSHAENYFKKSGLLTLEDGSKIFEVAHLPTASVDLLEIPHDVALHKHPDENHVMYILKGRAEVENKGKKTFLLPGDLIVMPKNTPHYLKHIGNEPLYILQFSSPTFDPYKIQWMKD